MSEISIYFSSLPASLEQVDWNSSQWGANLRSNFKEFPDLEGAKIALFSVEEYRGSAQPTSNEGAYSFRKHLYGLEWFDYFPSCVDLGVVAAGKNIEDSYFAMEAIVDHLVKKDIIPIIIGGSQDLTYAQYKGYSKLEQLVNMVAIDHRIDIGEVEDGTQSENYLTSIITHQPNFLFNFSNIGHQVYFNKQEKLQMMEKMFFEALRLGSLNNAVHLSEPLLRNADFVSIDLRSIRSEFMPLPANAMPNGFSGKDICQMAWYSGMSDKLSSIGIYEYRSEADPLGAGAMLLSQIIWYFVDGVAQRKGDFPKSSTRKYLKYTIHLNEDEHELIFYKSPKSDRWWVEVPYSDGRDTKYFRHLIVPCTYEDYQKASNGEMPDIWWQTFQKLT